MVLRNWSLFVSYPGFWDCSCLSQCSCWPVTTTLLSLSSIRSLKYRLELALLTSQNNQWTLQYFGKLTPLFSWFHRDGVFRINLLNFHCRYCYPERYQLTSLCLSSKSLTSRIWQVRCSSYITDQNMIFLWTYIRYSNDCSMIEMYPYTKPSAIVFQLSLLRFKPKAVLCVATSPYSFTAILVSELKFTT